VTVLPSSPPAGLVPRALMQQRWESLTFLHWAYSPDVVRRLLPDGLELQTWEDKAWVGLVPFRMRIGAGAGPYVMRFPETNVRTYVVGPDGRAGVWFFSLDASSLSAVVTARTTYRLPYVWSRMLVDRAGDTVSYRARRRTGAAAGHEISVRIGEPFEMLDPFVDWLTARFTLWNVVAGRPTRTHAAHPPWPLRRASVIDLREDLIAAAGLPAPTDEPLVQFSEGVDVRIGAPHRAG
jgi:uncharacterized protein YqjF (DUF2071 family)